MDGPAKGGHTGATGMAGGDHLHFSMLVAGVFVNPVEWWGEHRIEDNIEKKMKLFENPSPAEPIKEQPVKSEGVKKPKKSVAKKKG